MQKGLQAFLTHQDRREQMLEPNQLEGMASPWLRKGVSPPLWGARVLKGLL